LCFYPAAGLHSYPLFLTAFFILASGITLLQVAANPYVTVLGDVSTASSRLTLTQAFNSLGTTLAPFFGSLLILSTAVKSADEIKLLNADELSAYQATEAAAVQNPYLFLAAVLFLLAAIFASLKLPRVQAESEQGQVLAHDDQANAWQYPHLVLGAVAIFLYVGGEVAIGSFLVNFLGEPSVAGLPEHEAGRYVSFYWGGAMVGRFMGAAVMRAVRPGMVLAFNAVSAAALVLLTILSSGSLAMWAILAVGLFNSIMFPTIFSLAVSGLGRHTGQGSGILCAAIVGGAIVPVIQGAFADSFGIQHAFFVPVLCYGYIAFYGWRCRSLVAY
jgi:FHS family L-fucose permease-like MFS transporter